MGNGRGHRVGRTGECPVLGGIFGQRVDKSGNLEGTLGMR